MSTHNMHFQNKIRALELSQINKLISALSKKNSRDSRRISK